MSEITFDAVERGIKATAGTVLRNEQHFCELDALAGDGDFGNSLAAGFRVIEADLPTIEVDRSQLEDGVPLANLVADAGLAVSRSEARRLAQGGGLRVNDAPEPDAQRLVTLADIGAGGVIKLAAGKKKIVLVRPS